MPQHLTGWRLGELLNEFDSTATCSPPYMSDCCKPYLRFLPSAFIKPAFYQLHSFSLDKFAQGGAELGWFPGISLSQYFSTGIFRPGLSLADPRILCALPMSGIIRGCAGNRKASCNPREGKPMQHEPVSPRAGFFAADSAEGFWQSQAPPAYTGHSHFWERALSRRNFVQVAGGASGLLLASKLLSPASARAWESAAPKPIPG